MAITREEVLHVARLASLELTEAEVERLTDELSAILEAVSKVSELDLTDVPPTSHPLELVNAWAEDEPHASLPLEQPEGVLDGQSKRVDHPAPTPAKPASPLLGRSVMPTPLMRSAAP